MKKSSPILTLMIAMLCICCSTNKQADTIEYAKESTLPNDSFPPSYPDDEALYLLREQSSPKPKAFKSQTQHQKLDHLAYITTSRGKYRRSDGTYDYEMLNADLYQTSMNTGIPVVKGDQLEMKSYMKRVMGNKYNEILTLKLFHDADSVWNVYTRVAT